MPVWAPCVACVASPSVRRTVYDTGLVSLASEHCAHAEVYRTSLHPTVPAVNTEAKYLGRSETVVSAD